MNIYLVLFKLLLFLFLALLFLSPELLSGLSATLCQYFHILHASLIRLLLQAAMVFSSFFPDCRQCFFFFGFFSLVFLSFVYCIQLCLHYINGKFFITLCHQPIFQVSKGCLIFFWEISHDMNHEAIIGHLCHKTDFINLIMLSSSFLIKVSRPSVVLLGASIQTASREPKAMVQIFRHTSWPGVPIQDVNFLCDTCWSCYFLSNEMHLFLSYFYCPVRTKSSMQAYANSRPPQPFLSKKPSSPILQGHNHLFRLFIYANFVLGALD